MRAQLCVCGGGGYPNNVPRRFGQLKERKAVSFGGLVVFINRPKQRPLFVIEGENSWRQRDLISVAEIGLAAIKALLTHS